MTATRAVVGGGRWRRLASAAQPDARRHGAHRTTPLAVAALLTALLLATVAVPAAAVVREVGPVGLTVSDLDRAVEFFTGVLGFERLHEEEVWGPDFERLQGVFGARARVARLRLGREEIELTEYLAPAGLPYPADTRGNDRWFQHIAIVVSDMEAAYRHLRAHGVRHASTGPQRLPDWNPAAGGIEAFYFRGPDGHFLELIRFPPGKGDPRWQQPAPGLSALSELFLGIDHTAIVVADTDASLAFYRDRLGLEVAGESENWDVEQEHLNNVFGARLRITALRAPGGGPGIELLEYLAPGGGRPAPPDLRANDLAHWQTRLVVAVADAAERGLRGAGGRLVSPGAVRLAAPRPGLAAGALIRDPDGHGLLLSEPQEAPR